MTKREKAKRLKEARRYGRRMEDRQAGVLHTHKTHVEGCFRCDLSRDEVAKAKPPRVAKTDSGLYVVHDEVVRTV